MAGKSAKANNRGSSLFSNFISGKARDFRTSTNALRRRYVPPMSSVTGGTITTPGNGFKYHFFTSPGTLVIGSAGLADYVMIAGGGSGGSYSSSYLSGTRGTPSTFNSETAVGGGGGVAYNKSSAPEAPGGSGGGQGGAAPAGFGAGENFPGPIQQGFPGGDQGGTDGGGGGGGAGGAGLNAPSNTQPGAGGIGKAAFSGDTGVPPSYGTPGPSAGRWFAGGGGGGSRPAGAPGGIGGGGAGGASVAGTAGTANTGGGGGGGENGVGAGHGGGGAGGYIEKIDNEFSAATYPITVGGGAPATSPTSGAGGSGIVIVRYRVT